MSQNSLVWEEKFSVGFQQIDVEHRILFSLYNQLLSDCERNQGAAVIGDSLDKLLAYTKTHFAHEEQILEEKGYSQLSAHKEAHKKLVEQVEALRDRYYTSQDEGVARETMDFVHDWLTKHVLGVDMAYAAELNFL